MSEEKKTQSITFNYIKADNFHSILATGVIGGITVNSLIDMNFFTDRVTIPQKITFEVQKSGIVSKEIGRDSKDGSVREVHFGAIIDTKTAKSLIAWLNEKINIIESNKKT